MEKLAKLPPHHHQNIKLDLANNEIAHQLLPSFQQERWDFTRADNPETCRHINYDSTNPSKGLFPATVRENQQRSLL